MAVYGTSRSGDRTRRHSDADRQSGSEHRHRNSGGGGNLRAAVFGVNDGLVSNASLILGVAGASSDPKLVLVSGIAGLAAGAFAMAAGEYVSVRSQRELFEYQIGLERDELEQYPEAEAQELALIYAAKGLPQREADQARASRSSPIRSTRSTRWRARSWGSIPASWARPSARPRARSSRSPPAPRVPLVPFALRPRQLRALPLAVAVHRQWRLFAVGAALSLFTGRSALVSGAAHARARRRSRARVTFGIGRLVRCRARLTGAR